MTEPTDNPEPVAPLTRRCMCEGVTFEVSEALYGALWCHCERCQRRTGTSVSISGLTPIGSFHITKGEDRVGTYRPGDDRWAKSFCRECGSALFTSHPENDELIAVRLGALDQDPGVRPNVHQFVDYAPAWAPVPDVEFPSSRKG